MVIGSCSNEHRLTVHGVQCSALHLNYSKVNSKKTSNAKVSNPEKMIDNLGNNTCKIPGNSRRKFKDNGFSGIPGISRSGIPGCPGLDRQVLY